MLYFIKTIKIGGYNQIKKPNYFMGNYTRIKNSDLEILIRCAKNLKSILLMNIVDFGLSSEEIIEIINDGITTCECCGDPIPFDYLSEEYITRIDIALFGKSIRNISDFENE